MPAVSVRRERRGTQSRGNSERHKSEKTVPLLRGKEMTGGTGMKKEGIAEHPHFTGSQRQSALQERVHRIVPNSKPE